tara:strand:- start:1299 stop:1484 length:186 start_codon:yes stop_codon:yes gene_type:complete
LELIKLDFKIIFFNFKYAEKYFVKIIKRRMIYYVEKMNKMIPANKRTMAIIKIELFFMIKI